MAQKIPGWVWLAGLAGAGYVAYKFQKEIADWFNSLKKGAGFVTAPISDAAANLLIATDPYLSQPTAQSTLTGAVLFPNGAQVPVANLRVYASGSQARVYYQGRTYQLSPHDANGNYPAVLV